MDACRRQWSIEDRTSPSSKSMTEGTLYALTDETTPAATQTTSAYWPMSPSVYNAFATTYAIGVDGDGGTTYILSQEVTSVDFFNSFTPPFGMFTEPRTVVQTMVAGASYQKGTVAFFPANTAAPIWVPKIEYKCSYDLEKVSGRCVHAYIYGTVTTGYMTLEGSLQAIATLPPFSANGLVSNTQSESSSSARHKVSTGAIVGGVIGGILAIAVLLTIVVVLRRRRLRSRRY
ncbi:hypothetical protein DL96DRAFT_1713303 [Flagelloscypha sp. PMI_526]|nr:hypothetical protein DL96DRAFT_1713303 [Flagelloscypha sp. PMI_526]